MPTLDSLLALCLLLALLIALAALGYCAALVIDRALQVIVQRVLVWAARVELDCAYAAMMKSKSLGNCARYAKASTRYYETKYGKIS